MSSSDKGLLPRLVVDSEYATDGDHFLDTLLLDLSLTWHEIVNFERHRALFGIAIHVCEDAREQRCATVLAFFPGLPALNQACGSARGLCPELLRGQAQVNDPDRLKRQPEFLALYWI
jgi:hypothetical protein